MLHLICFESGAEDCSLTITEVLICDVLEAEIAYTVKVVPLLDGEQQNINEHLPIREFCLLVTFQETPVNRRFVIDLMSSCQ